MKAGSLTRNDMRTAQIEPGSLHPSLFRRQGLVVGSWAASAPGHSLGTGVVLSAAEAGKDGPVKAEGRNSGIRERDMDTSL